MASIVAASRGPGPPASSGSCLRGGPRPAGGWAPMAWAAPEQRPGRGRGGTSTRPPWAGGEGVAPNPPQAALTEEAQLPGRQAIKRMETRDGVSRQLEDLLQNLISFHFPPPPQPSSHPSPFPQHRLAVTLMPGPWCGTARALKVALVTLGGSVVGGTRDVSRGTQSLGRLRPHGGALPPPR